MRIYKAKDVRATFKGAPIVGLKDNRLPPDDKTPALYSGKCPTCGKYGPAACKREWWRGKEYFPCVGECHAKFMEVTAAMDLGGL